MSDSLWVGFRSSDQNTDVNRAVSAYRLRYYALCIITPQFGSFFAPGMTLLRVGVAVGMVLGLDPNNARREAP